MGLNSLEDQEYDDAIHHLEEALYYYTETHSKPQKACASKLMHALL